MSKTETTTISPVLFQQSTVTEGMVSRARLEIDQISLSRDASGIVIGLVALVEGGQAYFPLARDQCERLALALAPWLGGADG